VKRVAAIITMWGMLLPPSLAGAQPTSAGLTGVAGHRPPDTGTSLPFYIVIGALFLVMGLVLLWLRKGRE